MAHSRSHPPLISGVDVLTGPSVLPVCARVCISSADIDYVVFDHGGGDDFIPIIVLSGMFHRRSWFVGRW